MKIKLRWTDGFLIAGLVMIAVGIGMNIRQSQEKVEVRREQEQRETQVDSKVMIDIAGEVLKPGVYSLDRGARVNDALVASGGLSANADREWVEKNLNKAELIRDGQKILIPKKGQTLGKIDNPSYAETSEGEANTIININTATKEELETLTGIGPSLAESIIKYRQENSGFRDINEIKLVPGIGESKYEKIKDKIGI